MNSQSAAGTINPAASSSRSAVFKKILFVIKSGEYGGAEKHLVELVRRFAGSGIAISVLCLDKDFYTERLSDVRDLSLNVWSDQAVQSFWDWYQVFRKARPDEVVFVRAWLWCFPWHVAAAAWLAGVPRRVSIAQMTPPPPPKLVPYNIRCLAARVKRSRHLLAIKISAAFHDAMICVSDAIRESLVKDYGFAPDRTFTIYNGVCLTDFGPSDCDRVALRRKLRIGGQEFLFVSAARLSEQKRVDLLLTAMARLLRSGFQCKCLLVGDGPLKAELVRHAQELSLVDHVIFAGFHHDVRPYLQAADAFVLTSCREGLPLSIVEAMACGLPCVVTDVGGNREAVHHNVNGLVVPSGAVEAIADAMQYLIVHREKCAQMGRLARLRAADTFNMELLMGKIKAILLARPLASTSSNA